MGRSMTSVSGGQRPMADLYICSLEMTRIAGGEPFESPVGMFRASVIGFFLSCSVPEECMLVAMLLDNN